MEIRARLEREKPKAVDKGRQNFILLAILLGLAFLWYLAAAPRTITLQ